MSKQKWNNKIPWGKLSLELIVVFLGVTTGFLLNNWQLQREDYKLEQKYLVDFNHDIGENILELKVAISSDSTWLERVKPELRNISKGTIIIDSANSIVQQIVQISKITFQTSTYENITNSGNLNLIQDYALKKEIVDYHIAVSGVEFVDNYFYEFFNDFVMPFVVSKFNVLKGGLENPKTVKSLEFQNIITSYFSIMQQRKAVYEGLLEKSLELKKILQNNS